MTKPLSLAILTLWVALSAGASRMSSEITAPETWMITLHAFCRTAALTDWSSPALGSNERIFIDTRGCVTTSEWRKRLIIFSQMIDWCSSLFVYTQQWVSEWSWPVWSLKSYSGPTLAYWSNKDCRLVIRQKSLMPPDKNERCQGFKCDGRTLQCVLIDCCNKMLFVPCNANLFAVQFISSVSPPASRLACSYSCQYYYYYYYYYYKCTD